MKEKNIEKLIIQAEAITSEFRNLLYEDSHSVRVTEGQKKHIELLNVFHKMSNCLYQEKDKISTKVVKKYNRDMTRYSLEMNNPITGEVQVLKKLSKRKLPSEVYRYLIESEEITAGNIEEYQVNRFERNRFDRKFAPNTADILYDIDEKDAKRYERIEVSCENIERHFYIVNQWDKDSIEKFIEFMNDKFSKILRIESE